MATNDTKAAANGDASSRSGDEVLRMEDVLSGIVPEGADGGMLGAHLVFQTVGSNTVICIDTDGAGPAEPVAILTLANVAGKTLQQLLNDIPTDA